MELYRGYALRMRNTRYSVALLAAILAITALMNGAVLAGAEQTPPAQQPSTPPPAQPPAQSAPDASGPGDDNGVIALPKKKEKEPEPPPPPQPKVVNPPGLNNFSLRVDVPIVTVDVGVILEKTHQFVPNLQQANFRVFEDGVQQPISGFTRIQAPITAVLLLEFAAKSYYFIYDMRNAAWTFAQQLKPDDYVAVMTFDMRTQILTDFTQDKRVIYQSLNSLMIPGFSETNVFDALYETLDRVSRIEGRKYIVLIASGRDTFSKITLDKILAKIKATPDVTIFTVGTGQVARIMSNMGGMREMDYLQADNQMNTFAKMTGGMSFFPRFAGEMPDIFHQINDTIRNQYELSYKPTNPKQDGTYRKLRVELVDDEGQPLKMQDEKHKPLKYDIIARDGYRAKQQVE